jgi:CheY-like chemotaxis protein
VAAEDGAAALVAYRATPGFAAVVMDMSMPGMSGAQCFAALRAIDPEVRVLLVSGYADDVDLRTCLAHGAVGFLAKPYDRARLVAAIAAVVAGQAPSTDDGEPQPHLAP